MTRFLELSIGRMILLKGNKAPGAQFPLSPSPQPASHGDFSASPLNVLI